MSAWWLAWQEGFAGFAWPWAWAALPLPLLAWLLLPPRQSSAAALRVPWRRRLDQVAAVTTQFRAYQSDLERLQTKP